MLKIQRQLKLLKNYSKRLRSDIVTVKRKLSLFHGTHAMHMYKDHINTKLRTDNIQYNIIGVARGHWGGAIASKNPRLAEHRKPKAKRSYSMYF